MHENSIHLDQRWPLGEGSQKEASSGFGGFNERTRAKPEAHPDGLG